MADTRFMQKRYSVQNLLERYMSEIKNMRNLAQNPSDETKLQLYYQAAATFKRASIKDWVQFALSWGKSESGMSPQIRGAFPLFLGNRVSQASAVDMAYAELLFSYLKSFKKYRSNMSDWMLRFIINSRFSPLHGYFERALDSTIYETELKVMGYRSHFDIDS